MAAMATTPKRTVEGRGRRGRPPKYGQPGRVVAITLPTDTIALLQSVHGDLGWAIVTLAEQARHITQPAERRGPELAQIGRRQSLIVVEPAVVKSLPGVQSVPISDSQAFLALEPGRGMADLELAVADRLEQPGRASAQERQALERLLAQLRRWRRNRRLRFETRSIILVSQT